MLWGVAARMHMAAQTVQTGHLGQGLQPLYLGFLVAEPELRLALWGRGAGGGAGVVRTRRWKHASSIWHSVSTRMWPVIATV